MSVPQTVLLVSCLILTGVMALFDLKTQRVPMVLCVGSVIVLALIRTWFLAWSGALFISLLFLIAGLVFLWKLGRERSFGEADIWMVASLGIGLGTPQIWIAIWEASLIAGCVAVVLLLLKKPLKTKVPLLPILWAGAVCSLFLFPISVGTL